MPTLLVPDTNVFVQFTHFGDLPWREIAQEDDVVLIVLAAVVRELDKLKLEPRLRDRVRDVLPRIEDLFADGDAATLPTGIPARFEHGRGVMGIMLEHGLEQQLGDDRILAAVLHLRGGGERIVVVTDDSAVRLRARGLGLAVRAMPEKYRRPGADPLQAENSRLRRELDELRAGVPRLEVKFSEGGSVLKIARTPARPYKDAVSDMQRSHDEIMHFQFLSLDHLPAAYMFELEKPTQAEVNDYNEKFEKFLSSYNEFASERAAFESFLRRSVALELMLHNSGGRPAEGVKISVRLPDRATVVTEDNVPHKHEIPAGPKLPGRPRGVRTLADESHSMVAERAEALAMPEFQRLVPAPNVTGPSFAENQLRFEVGLLSNFDEVRLPRCFMSFPSSTDVRSSTLPYTVRSHSLAKLIEGELHIVVVARPRTSGG